ncbi:polysaccharide biosynthesis/export family protein [Mucilaginibacter arboris]|uniref:Polysaccharide export protein n=1 Tax=Mucilaginibacter arboris TaxID=2682090 RepID=A0A7K1SY51_9SPHI|nr:polysaccharide biosynthesis/export family protein [Mucilaginibacter arboris]MVN22249.1 polysaccharide export protein [Mucilaginibacter arboris]
MIKNLFYGLLLIFLVSSCATNKNLTYFKDVNRSSITTETAEPFIPVTIQPQDILAINISSLNPDASAVYNHGVVSTNATTVTGASDATAVANGYLVDKAGNIQLPILGNIKAAGYTVPEFKQALTTLLSKYLKEPYVTVTISNFKVTVMGDVGSPRVLRVQNDRLNLTDAITLAGDLSITAVRSDILLIREQNGKRSYIPINLNSKDIFNSPYYYLKNNDIIYVTPGKYKSTLAADNFSRNLGLIGGIVSLIILGVSLITR